jgi:uncharacterized protein
MIDTGDLSAFLLLLAVGAYVQTVTGFALGLVVMGTVTVFGLAPIAFSAVVVSISSLANTLLALRGDRQYVHWPSVVISLAALLPAMVGGIALLTRLSGGSVHTLRLLLGGFILISGVLLMLKPHPRPQLAGAAKTFAAGAFAGLFGGLFSTAGPPLVYHLYRQPLTIRAIRASLLAVFAVATTGRIAVVALAGDVTREMLWISLLSLPMVLGATAVARRFRPPLSDLTMRRMAFGLLMMLGVMLLVPSR